MVLEDTNEFVLLWEAGYDAERQNDTKNALQKYKQGCELAIRFLERDGNQERKELIKTKVAQILDRIASLKCTAQLQRAPNLLLPDPVELPAATPKQAAVAVSDVQPPAHIFNEYGKVVMDDVNQRVRDLEARFVKYTEAADAKIKALQEQVEQLQAALDGK